jgi:hypothetical protein
MNAGRGSAGADIEGSTVSFPRIERVIPFRWHPDSREIRATCTRWGERFLPDDDRRHGGREGASVRRIGVTEAGLWPALCYPDMDTERVLDVAKVCVALYWLDDIWHTDESDKLGRLAEAFDVFAGRWPGPDASVTAHVVREAWHPVLARMSDGFRARAIAAALAFVRGTATEIAELTHPGDAPEWAASDEAYTDQRFRSMACEFIWVMVEYCLGIDLAARFAAAPPLRDRMYRLCCEHFLCVNDLFSYRREYFAGEANVSYVTRFLDQGMTLQQAMDRLAGMVEDVERRYLDAATELRRIHAGRHDADAWLTGMLMTASGSFEYSYLSSRYHGVGAAVEDPHGRGWLPVRRTGPMVMSAGSTRWLGTPERID